MARFGQQSFLGVMRGKANMYAVHGTISLQSGTRGPKEKENWGMLPTAKVTQHCKRVDSVEETERATDQGWY